MDSLKHGATDIMIDPSGQMVRPRAAAAARRIACGSTSAPPWLGAMEPKKGLQGTASGSIISTSGAGAC